MKSEGEKDSIVVTITDKKDRKGKRTFSLKISADSGVFALSNVLSEHGAMPSFEKHFKELLQREVKEYSRQATQLMSKIASQSRSSP